jgi:hypothetical protein
MPTYARRLSDQLAADDWLSERIVSAPSRRSMPYPSGLEHSSLFS